MRLTWLIIGIFSNRRCGPTPASYKSIVHLPKYYFYLGPGGPTKVLPPTLAGFKGRVIITIVIPTPTIVVLEMDKSPPIYLPPLLLHVSFIIKNDLTAILGSIEIIFFTK